MTTDYPGRKSQRVVSDVRVWGVLLNDWRMLERARVAVLERSGRPVLRCNWECHHGAHEAAVVPLNFRKGAPFFLRGRGRS